MVSFANWTMAISLFGLRPRPSVWRIEMWPSLKEGHISILEYHLTCLQKDRRGQMPAFSPLSKYIGLWRRDYGAVQHNQPGYDQEKVQMDQGLLSMAFHNRRRRADNTLPPTNGGGGGELKIKKTIKNNRIVKQIRTAYSLGLFPNPLAKPGKARTQSRCYQKKGRKVLNRRLRGKSSVFSIDSVVKHILQDLCWRRRSYDNG